MEHWEVSVSTDLQYTLQALVNSHCVCLFAVTPCQTASHAHESLCEYLKLNRGSRPSVVGVIRLYGIISKSLYLYEILYFQGNLVSLKAQGQEHSRDSGNAGRNISLGNRVSRISYLDISSLRRN